MTSVHQLWPNVVSRSMVLSQPGSLLIYTVPVTSKGCVNAQNVGCDHVAVQDHTFAGPMPIKEACITTTQGNDDIRVQAAAHGHFWVSGPAATVVYVDVCYPSSHANHEWKYMLNHVLKYKSHASLPLIGPG